MRHELVSFIVVGVVASVTTLGVQELTRTFVVNLESPHPIEGEVVVPAPIPHSDMASMIDVVVAPATRNETGLWTDVGVLDTTRSQPEDVGLESPLQSGRVVDLELPTQQRPQLVSEALQREVADPRGQTTLSRERCSGERRPDPGVFAHRPVGDQIGPRRPDRPLEGSREIQRTAESFR